jgi:hypothetical protein
MVGCCRPCDRPCRCRLSCDARVRPDIAAAAGTIRFLVKFVITITLAVSAFGLARALSRPGETWREAVPYLEVPPALVALAVIVELVLLPPDTWWARMTGRRGRRIACRRHCRQLVRHSMHGRFLLLFIAAPRRPALPSLDPGARRIGGGEASSPGGDRLTGKPASGWREISNWHYEDGEAAGRHRTLHQSRVLLLSAGGCLHGRAQILERRDRAV